MRRLIGVGTLLALLPSAAIAAVPQRHTAAGMATARRALLRRADLGPGWSEEAVAPKRVAPLTCPQFDPSSAGVVETGAAGSATYQQSSSGPWLAQSSYVYGTGAQASEYWGRIVRPQLSRCVADALQSGSGHGVRFTVTGRQELHLPALPARAAGYRVTGAVSGSGQSGDVWLDLVVLARGRTIAALSVSSFSQPPARELELRLARGAARRLPAG